MSSLPLAAMLALLLTGCGPDGSREFAVTLDDAEQLSCVGFSSTASLEQETLDSLAKELTKARKKMLASDLPVPVGRTLFVNEMEGAMQAWFEASSALGGSARQYDSPQCVYRGLLHDDYIEGSYDDLFNTDEADEEAGREPCGDRARSSGTLQLTDALGIAGRIRWRDYHYIDTVASACDAHIRCERDIRIEGLEK